MEETPREYKKKIDDAREKRRKNRDKFLEYLQKYELVDKRFKAKTKQEILANFEKNEKAEKGSELYTKIGQELDTIEIKYQSLESLKELLETKNKEKTEIVEKLRGFSMRGKDETTLNLQRVEMKKLEEDMKKLNEEIKGIEQEIQNRENEIKDTEETYGEKVKEDIGDLEGKNEQTAGNANDVPMEYSGEKTRPASLRDYRRFVLNELAGIDHTRHEIIKLLNDGIGVDEDIKKKIEDEISKKFFDYYDEKKGSLRMKVAQSIGIRKNVYECKNEIDEYYGEIGGKPCFRTKKDGNYCIIRGEEQLGGINCYIDCVQEIGGKPCFELHNSFERWIIRGNEQCGDCFDYIHGSKIQEIGGKPCFIAKKNGKYCLMRGTEQYSNWFNNIGYPQEIGGKPCFRAGDNGKYCLMRGIEQYSDWFEWMNDPQEIGGKPCFEVKKNGKRCIMRGKEQQGDWFDYYIRVTKDIGGKPCFIAANKDGKYRIIWGKEQQGDWYDDMDNLQEIGGKPCFIAKKDGKRCIMRGNEQYSEWYDDVRELKEIGGKPCFIAEKNCKRCVMRGEKQLGNWYYKILELKEIGGLPAFVVEDDYQCLFRGGKKYTNRSYNQIIDFHECEGKPVVIHKNSDGYYIVNEGEKKCGNIMFERMGDIKEIGGKPLFWVKSNGKYHIIRGDKVYAGGFDSIDIYGEIGGEPAYYAKKKNKKYLMLGKEEYIDLNEKKFDNISDLNEIGGKIFYKAYRRMLQCFMIGNQQCTDRCDEIKILNVNKKEGTVTIATRIEEKKEIITFHINELSDDGETGTVIDDTQIGQEEGSIDTQRGQREKVIIERYEKLLNLKELIKYLKEDNILENSELSELSERLSENFFKNYEKAKEDDDFQAADKEYKELKELKKRHKAKSKELKSKSGPNNENLKSIEEQMMKIADETMEIESAKSLKRLMLSKVRKNRDKLETSKKNISKLKHENYKLKREIEEQSESYGPKIDRRKLRGKSEEELKKLLNIGKVAQANTYKEYKEKHNEMVENFDKIIGYIKGLNLGISEELKDEIIKKIETHISSIIQEQEGGNLLKMANDTEKYLEENLGNIINKLKELEKQIKESEEKITKLEEKRKTSNDDELIQINDEIYELMQQQIKLNDEYEEIKKSINEILYNYDRSDIESKL